MLQDQKSQQEIARERNLQSTNRETRHKNQPPPRPPSPKLADRPDNEKAQLVKDIAPPTEMSKEQLQARLRELLCKKDKLDKLIQVLFFFLFLIYFCLLVCFLSVISFIIQK